MVTIADIEQKWVRRAVLAVAVVPVWLVVILCCVAETVLEETIDLARVTASAWRGKR